MRFRNYFQTTLLETLIFEGKVEHIAKNQGEKLLARFDKDPSSRMPEWKEDKKNIDSDDQAKRMGVMIAVINWFADHVSKTYLQWVINRYIA